MPSHTTPEARQAKRRSSVACQRCRSRKVRCNIVQNGPPCVNCRLDGAHCVAADTRRRILHLVQQEEDAEPSASLPPTALPPIIEPLPSRLSPEDLAYLDHAGVFAIPEEPTLHKLLDACRVFGAYFMPSLDWCDCMAPHDSEVPHCDGKLTLLELHAMMFAGSAVSVSSPSSFHVKIRQF